MALVPGATAWPGGQSSPALARRARPAAGLWHAGRVEVSLGCGGVGRYPPAEARVPEGAILREAASTGTRAKLPDALPLPRGLGAGAEVVDTDPRHARLPPG